MPKKVLIVDDDPILRKTVQAALQAEKFSVVVAADTMSALTQTRNEKPDLILLDLGLPAGGGFTFLDRLKVFPAFAGIPIIVVSGQDRAVAEPRAKEAGVSVYLEKPVLPQKIVEHVKFLLGES
jgi:DNA-binding response OmpR family regulator